MIQRHLFDTLDRVSALRRLTQMRALAHLHITILPRPPAKSVQSSILATINGHRRRTSVSVVLL